VGKTVLVMLPVIALYDTSACHILIQIMTGVRKRPLIFAAAIDVSANQQPHDFDEASRKQILECTGIHMHGVQEINKHEPKPGWR
jgi:hypothetical protein